MKNKTVNTWIIISIIFLIASLILMLTKRKEVDNHIVEINYQEYREIINKDEYSIDDLKGKNAAVCADRAALAQNLFSILGVESYYLVGQVNGEDHAYNVINYKGNYLLYDSSKDIPRYENGKLINWLAYVKPISIEQMEVLLNGGKISFEDG